MSLAHKVLLKGAFDVTSGEHMIKNLDEIYHILDKEEHVLKEAPEEIKHFRGKSADLPREVSEARREIFPVKEMLDTVTKTRDMAMINDTAIAWACVDWPEREGITNRFCVDWHFVPREIKGPLHDVSVVICRRDTRLQRERNIRQSNAHAVKNLRQETEDMKVECIGTARKRGAYVRAKT
ncbi:MAG: hypothetical protein M1816_003486 [Peltula sp. TS41687]|nr:MAG: hypothetical protein M1816_003486 [Peltula sp. TS41687]